MLPGRYVKDVVSVSQNVRDMQRALIDLAQLTEDARAVPDSLGELCPALVVSAGGTSKSSSLFVMFRDKPTTIWISNDKYLGIDHHY